MKGYELLVNIGRMKRPLAVDIGVSLGYRGPSCRVPILSLMRNPFPLNCVGEID